MKFWIFFFKVELSLIFLIFKRKNKIKFKSKFIFRKRQPYESIIASRSNSISFLIVRMTGKIFLYGINKINKQHNFMIQDIII